MPLDATTKKDDSEEKGNSGNTNSFSTDEEAGSAEGDNENIQQNKLKEMVSRIEYC
jgi:hypothetical protein